MELECKSADKGSCAVGNAIVGMVIGGRAARACDVCGKERARWYCAADLAYLCERCDGSVHSANAVAGRHERVRLGPDGAPLKMTQKLSTSAKRDAAAAAGPSPGANLNPRKKPRSIRRHKPSSVHASKHGISLSPATNRIANSSLNLSNSLMYAPNHSIMINNPRNNLDFIANGNMEFNNKFVVKAEPLSPVDIGEQVKVPDHTDDDPLFESLFDFRDLQDDDLFLHQVPIYIPGAHNQGNSPAICDSKQYIENDETKPTIIITPYEESKELGLSTSSCATTHPSGPSQAQFDSASLPVGKEAEDNGALLSGKCEEPDRFIDSGTGLCELDQIDFDSMLHGDDEDGAEESHTNNICALHADVNSYDYTDASNCPITRDGSGSYAEDSCAHHGTDMVDDDDIDDNYDAAEHAGHGEAFDIDTMGSESPRTWLCKVKVESPPELDGMLQANGGYDDALLKQKLSCKADSQSGFKLGLKLNFEDVLHAWSDRGTFWMDGHPPLQLDNCLDFLGGWFVPDMSSTSTSTEGDGQHLVPVINHKCKKSDGSAREASVMRYREKRRTRLFCKKIRYEVRKLNAEKRPRMKGRFVKRNSIAI